MDSSYWFHSSEQYHSHRNLSDGPARRQTPLRHLLNGMCLGILIGFFCVVQTSFLPYFPILGVKADIVLPAIVALALFLPAKPLVIAVFAAGFLTDAIGSLGISARGLMYLGIALCIYAVVSLSFRRNVGVFLLATAAAKLVCELFTLTYLLTQWTSMSLPTVFVQVLLPEFLYTLLLSPLVYFFVKFYLAVWRYPTARKAGFSL